MESSVGIHRGVASVPNTDVPVSSVGPTFRHFRSRKPDRIVCRETTSLGMPLEGSLGCIHQLLMTSDMLVIDASECSIHKPWLSPATFSNARSRVPLGWRPGLELAHPLPRYVLHLPKSLSCPAYSPPGVSILSHCLSRRLAVEHLTSFRGLSQLSWPRLCVILVFLDSWLFLFSSTLFHSISIFPY